MSKKYQQLSDCACATLRQSSRLITQYYEEAFKPEGITSSQFNVLSVLINTGPVPVSQLATLMVQDRTGLTRNLNIMQKNNWIEFMPGEDRRIKLVQLTRQGKDKLDRTLPQWKQAQKRVSKQLGGIEGIRQQLEALKRLA